MLAFLAGCAGLQRDRVQFDGLSDCPKQTAAKLVAKQSQLGPLSDTHTPVSYTHLTLPTILRV